MTSNRGLRKFLIDWPRVFLVTFASMAIWGMLSTNVVYPAASARQQGVGSWNFSNGSAALAKINASWFYTWGPDTKGITAPPSVEFVPMISGINRMAEIDKAKSLGTTLLGFNEPDSTKQAQMTPQQALDLWPQLMATNMRLGSPAPTDNGQKRGGWLDQFMSGAKARGYRVDFICLHKYEKNFADPIAAVEDLRAYLEAVHEKYPDKPIWLTEFALANYNSPGAKFPTEDQQAAFAAASVRMLRTLPYVERYAWFSLSPPKDPTDTRALADPNGNLTKVGLAYESAALASR